MRSMILSVLAMALLIGIPGTATVAQTSGLPPGDYQQTCRNIRANGNQLIASCQKKDGHWRNTSIDSSTCSGGIVNDDGQLRCAGGGSYGGGWQGPTQALPPGDYQKSCQNIHINGSDLVASCQKKDGSWKDTTLKNANSCGGRIINMDGNLRCM
jgi:hypothetical protein